MKLIFSLLLTLFMSALASAQHGLDLPISKPKFSVEKETKESPPTNEDDEIGDDPRDTPPPTFFGEELNSEGRNSIVYVLDLSCSMKLIEPNPFHFIDGNLVTGSRSARAITEVIKSISTLTEEYKFSFVIYGTAGWAWKIPLIQATPVNKVAAAIILMTKVNQCLGMTTTGPYTVHGIHLEETNKHVVLMTDGEPNWDGASVRKHEWHRDMIRNRNNGSRVDVFGIHVGNLPAARTFCRNVASDNGGIFYEID